MEKIAKPGSKGPLVKHITKEAMMKAIKATMSAHAAARYLHVSYLHFKKYAILYTDEESGKNLLEYCKNPKGKGIPRYWFKRGDPAKNIPLMDLIEGRVPIHHFNPQKVKARLIAKGLVQECCAKCGMSERRVTDRKIPLILHHKDNNKENFHLDNLEFLCYNCSFLYAISPITQEQAEAMEDFVDRQTDTFTWELDDFQKSQLESLGLWSTGEKPGMEYATGKYKKYRKPGSGQWKRDEKLRKAQEKLEDSSSL